MSGASDTAKTTTNEERTESRTTSRRLFLFGLVTVVASLLSGLATYLILTGLTSIVPTHEVVVTMLLVNGVLVLAMIAMIAIQVVALWRARRRQAAGAQLHVRIVGLFSIIAVLPAIALAIFASVSLDRGLDHWFSSRTKSIIENSITVATAYLREHGQVIRADVVSMAADIDQAVALVETSPQQFGRFLTAQAAIRSIPGAYLIDGKSKLLATTGALNDKPFEPPPPKAIEVAQEGKAVVIAPGKANKVGAIMKLQNYNDTYLYIIRPVNPRVLQHLRQTRASVVEYKKLEQRRTGVQVAFAMMYLAIALTLLLAAIWLGLWFSNRLVAPIRRLIAAAQEVSQGNLNVQVGIKASQGDLGHLGATFNDMTSELRSQRDDLITANTQLDDRRRFTEAVLSGVTAGVIGVDAQGQVTLTNPSAEDLLGNPKKRLVGQPLETAVPEFEALFAKARKQRGRPVHDHVHLIRDSGEHTFAVRVTTERADDEAHGFVITFDDITELVVAQRTSAWADVARRIAHEIKNPLTPIQLSAERIKRKYGDSITKDREIFDQCTETIIRQVGDIGRMVDEFSSFARMPKPVMEKNDIREIVRDAVFLFHVGNPEIRFKTDLPADPVVSLCDRRLLSQAVTNLVKNATEAIDSLRETVNGEEYSGLITARVRTRKGRFTIEVEDNGPGLPKEGRNRLVEPYRTTRTKGTGLGLAIVQKVTEQHGGTLQLRDAASDVGESGACIRLEFPLAAAADESADAPKGQDDRTAEDDRDASPGTSESKNRQRGKRARQGASHGV